MRCSPPRARRAAPARRASRCRSAAHTAASADLNRPRPPRAGRWGDRPGRGCAAGSIPAYFRRSASSGARVPLQVAWRTRPASSSKSASQIQETSRPSAILSLRTPSRSCSPGSERERAQHLVGAGGILDEQDPHLAPADVHGLGAAERGLRGLQSRNDLGQAHLQRGGERGGGERVVDVVEAGQRRGRPRLRPQGSGG